MTDTRRDTRRTGCVYLIGAGPGNPGLLTLRGAELLRRADVVLYDALIHPDVLRHCRADAELRFVGKRAGQPYARQKRINEWMLTEARNGRTVARLKGGDPYLFGRGSEEAEALSEAGVPFEVVPGVPSSVAAAAYAGVSLTHRTHASSVAYITATESDEKDESSHDWSKLATATQTLVIFMGMRALAAMMQRLIDHGRSPSTPALVVQWASLPAQRTVTGTIADIADKASGAGMGLPALTIVGDVVGLRTRLRWFDNRPLFGKRVLVTRPPHQAGSLAHLLLEQGAEPVVLPTIDIKRIDPNPELDQALRRLAAYDWIVFTSQNAVQEFFSALTAARLDTRALGRCQVAAIGTATSERLRAHGIAADLIPGLFQGEGVIDSLRERLGDNLRGVRFLIPRASVARVLIPQSIRALGGIVDVVALYHTVPTEPATQAAIVDALQSKTIDIVTFTSSSTVDQFMTAVGPALAESHACLDDVVFASIGPITTTRARELGLRVHVTASEFTTDGLVRALVQHYE